MDADLKTVTGGAHVDVLEIGRGVTPKVASTFGGLPPSLRALQTSVEAPYLDPKRKDGWTVFERQWKQWSKYQFWGVCAGGLEDEMRRDLLVTRLHKVFPEQVRDMISQEPSTSFQDVWNFLKKYFKVDDPHYWRGQWQDIKLRRSGDTIEISEWLVFKSRFLGGLRRVEDYTESEVVEPLLKNLSSRWIEDVMKEEARRSKMGGRVKWIGGGNLDAKQVQYLGEKFIVVLDRGKSTNVALP